MDTSSLSPRLRYGLGDLPGVWQKGQCSNGHRIMGTEDFENRRIGFQVAIIRRSARERL